MLLKYFYDENLAQASYMVGCQASKEAFIIDPARNILPYLNAATKEGLHIVGALETHIHADFVAGTRELSQQIGAKMYLSDEGDADWKYENIGNLPHQLVKDGNEIMLGNISFQVMHTPGHTPESISFLVTDGGVKAEHPIGIFTGDFVFVGDVGRPDLLEKSAQKVGTADKGAKDMYNSLSKFKRLPDYVQVWPGHGAGSPCGKSLGAIPSSTVGYEKQVSWAFQHEDYDSFAKELLDGQPEPPKYFGVMKRVNKVGPNFLEDLEKPKRMNDITSLNRYIEEGIQVIDTREAALFSKEHIEGTINIPFNLAFTNWAGWIIDYERPLYLLTDPYKLEEIQMALQSIGIDKLEWYMDVDLAIRMTSELESYHDITPKEVKELISSEGAQVVDVRYDSEWKSGHIEGAQHIMLGDLSDRLDEVPNDRPLILQCGSGVRSAIAISLLQANGFKDVHNMLGGYARWQKDMN
ncbi:MBL fold metallo-hydrolase [Sutcliffiella horikoshii]|uniref:MBL fold metallo-hydrolase n=1 Tax=Sutcliffiella horikoshii TaxID=79883 RepID=UPI00203BF3B2|nr:MBL fold metallo-hydrolase [Sutcliffiella horikoshii]MCM3618154.1 MBL fold metallo-hydrolase [Sutcliffiella horikoshii]